MVHVSHASVTTSLWLAGRGASATGAVVGTSDASHPEATPGATKRSCRYEMPRTTRRACLPLVGFPQNGLDPEVPAA